MKVLVYFDGAQQRSSLRTIALLGKKFVFDLDLLSNSAIPDRELWSSSVQGTLREIRAEGTFEQAVTKACRAMRYDLVVAAPNDRRGIVRMLLGSRIGRFISAAPATIWVPRGDNVLMRRIVVGVSGGPQSEQDARLAARLALAYDVRLELVYVVSQIPLFYTTLAEFHEALASDAKIALMAPGVIEVRRIFELLKAEGVQVEMIIRAGTVSDELMLVCSGSGKQPKADLLVIGAHAPATNAGTDYLENLAEEIVESAPCPTLVVHAMSEWSEWELVEQASD